MGIQQDWRLFAYTDTKLQYQLIRIFCLEFVYRASTSVGYLLHQLALLGLAILHPVPKTAAVVAAALRLLPFWGHVPPLTAVFPVVSPPLIVGPAARVFVTTISVSNLPVTATPAASATAAGKAFPFCGYGQLAWNKSVLWNWNKKPRLANSISNWKFLTVQLHLLPLGLAQLLVREDSQLFIEHCRLLHVLYHIPLELALTGHSFHGVLSLRTEE